jgi:Chorismate synthase
MDGLIAQAVMSVPTVKAVEIGRGKDASNFKGSEFQDRFLSKDGEIIRETNNAGGIEGGITNGEDITVKFYSKPIPTVRKGIRSVDLDKWVETQSIYVRSDTVVLPAVTLISASRISFVLASSFLKKFSGDHIDDVKASFDYYLSSRRHFWQR